MSNLKFQIKSHNEQQSNSKTDNPGSSRYGSQQIIQGLEQLSILIESFQKIIQEIIEMIKFQISQEQLKKFTNNQQGIEDYNQILSIKYMELDKSLINLKISQEDQLNEMEEQEMKFIKQSGQSIENMINQIKQTNRKNSDLDIIDESTIKKTKTSHGPMAFANEGFDPNSQSYAFSFNIQKIVGNLLVGVGNDEGIKESSYINSKVGDELGHNLYMINSWQKYTYHHTDQEFQSKRKGFVFKTGDKIQIKYDHVTKVLEFRKQKDVVEMSITDMSKILYPCVYCIQAGDQVQIAEY